MRQQREELLCDPVTNLIVQIIKRASDDLVSSTDKKRLAGHSKTILEEERDDAQDFFRNERRYYRLMELSGLDQIVDPDVFREKLESKTWRASNGWRLRF